MLVDLVGEDDDARMAGEHLHQPLDFLTVIDRAGGVGGGAEHHHAGLVGDGGLELGGSHLEALLHRGGDKHGGGSGELHHLDIADPGGDGNHHLVAGVYSGEDDIAQGLLRPGRHHHLGGLERGLVLAAQFLGHSLAQAHVAGHR